MLRPVEPRTSERRDEQRQRETPENQQQQMTNLLPADRLVRILLMNINDGNCTTTFFSRLIRWINTGIEIAARPPRNKGDRKFISASTSDAHAWPDRRTARRRAACPCRTARSRCDDRAAPCRASPRAG